MISAAVNGITSAACGGSDSSAAQFAKISAQISGVSDQISALSTSVKGLAQNLNWLQLSTNMQKYNANQLLISGWIQNYFNLLNMKGEDGKIHETLKGLVDSYGGLQMALKGSPIQGALTDLLTSAKTDVKIPVNELNSINLGTLNYQTIQSLQNMCGKSSEITGDAFSIRGTCNAYIAQISTANVTNSYTLYNKILADVSETYNESPGNPVVANLPTNDEIKNYYTTFNQDFTLEKIGYKPFYANELPKQLVSDITESSGKFKCKILEWNAIEMNLLTSCTINGSEIRSKYYYKEKNDKNNDFDAEVMNVMGVFVPKRFFHGGTSSYGSNDAFPWLNWSYPAEASNTMKRDFDNLATKYYLNVPKTVAISYYGTSLSKISTDTILPNGGGYLKFSRNNIDYTRDVLTKYSETTDSIKLFTKFYGADFWPLADDSGDLSTNDIFSFIRYTDSSGLSRVWAIRNKLMNGLGDAGRTGLELRSAITMQCMTNECDITDDSNRWPGNRDDRTFVGKVKFKVSADNYLSIGWSGASKNSDDCNDSVYSNSCEYNMTVNGKSSF
jgi:hypothetical protein